jgi:hypothetical protein
MEQLSERQWEILMNLLAAHRKALTKVLLRPEVEYTAEDRQRYEHTLEDTIAIECTLEGVRSKVR